MAPIPRPFDRGVALALGLLLVGCAAFGFSRFLAGEGAGYGVGAGALGVLGVDALISAVRGRRAWILRVGPLP